MILRTGRTDENVLDRSVLKRLGAVYSGSSDTEEGCFYSESVSWKTSRCGMLAVTGAINGLSAKGIGPSQIRTDLLLPVGFEEQGLRDLEDDIRDTAVKAHVLVVGGHTEVTSAVTRPIVTVEAFGTEKISVQGTSVLSPGEYESFKDLNRKNHDEDASCEVRSDILLIGHIGLSGTFLLASERRDELEKRFPVQMIDRALSMQDHLLIPDSVCGCGKQNLPFPLVRVSCGGIYAGLWKLAAKWNCGFEVDLPAIPIFQETIEICNFFDINPYQMSSEGCFLVLAENGEKAENSFAEAGIYARKIGRMTAGRDKIIANGEERQCLNRPAPDSLIPLLG